MTTMKMQIKDRAEIGKNKVNKLRAANLIPGVIYSRGEESQHINVNSVEFLRVYRVAGTSSMIDLELNGKKIPVIIKDIQRHPVKGELVHIDFQKLNMDEKLKMFIPISLNNRDNIILQPSILTQQLDQVEIECLPGDIPFQAEVDVADMDFTTPIFVKDLDIANNSKVEILTDLEIVVCTLSEPAKPAETDGEESEEALESSEETTEE